MSEDRAVPEPYLLFLYVEGAQEAGIAYAGPRVEFLGHAPRLDAAVDRAKAAPQNAEVAKARQDGRFGSLSVMREGDYMWHSDAGFTPAGAERRKEEAALIQAHAAPALPEVGRPTSADSPAPAAPADAKTPPAPAAGPEAYLVEFGQEEPSGDGERGFHYLNLGALPSLQAAVDLATSDEVERKRLEICTNGGYVDLRVMKDGALLWDADQGYTEAGRAGAPKTTGTEAKEAEAPPAQAPAPAPAPVQGSAPPAREPALQFKGAVLKEKREIPKGIAGTFLEAGTERRFVAFGVPAEILKKAEPGAVLDLFGTPNPKRPEELKIRAAYLQGAVRTKTAEAAPPAPEDGRT